MANKNYNAPKNTKELKATDPENWEAKVAKQVIEEWEKGQTFQTSLNEMYEDLYLMMRGKRPKKQYDYQSDLTLRKAFQVLWKMITYVSQKIYGASPIIGVAGHDKEGCWQRETLLETWMEEDKYFMVVVQGLLRLGLNGTVIGKKSWKQKLVTIQGQNGQRQSFPVEDRPEDIIVNNKDIVVDWLLRPGQSITESRFIIHREVTDFMTLFNSKVNYQNLDDVKGKTLDETQEAEDHAKVRQEDDQESPPESGMYREVELFERQGLWPVKVSKKGDIRPIFDKEEIYSEGTQWKQMLVTVADYRNPVLVRWEENPYGEMNYWDGHLYLDAERWQSQGVLEPAKDVFIAQDDNLNAMFDEIWRNLFPPTVINKFAPGIEWDTIKWAPSQMWLVGGNPNDNILVTRGTEITRDAWTKHQMLEGEIQTITPVTHSIAGMGKEKTATLGALNATFSSSQLDFIVKMVEVTWLIPSSKMTLRFAQKFAHDLTFIAILGKAFQFDKFLDEYRFRPCASSVKLPEQREIEIQQDIQMIQVVGAMQNPNTAKVVNYFLKNILRNRNRQEAIALLDENYFEPQTPGGQIERMMGGNQPAAGSASNEQGLSMSPGERSMRGRTYQPRMLQ